MAKVTGIDAGEFAVKAVVLDGSYRKTRLLRSQVEPLLDDGAGGLRAETVADAVRLALKEGHIVASDARLGYPCREAVLRTLEVPFSGRDAIRKIIKSEVEGAIHSHSVDDMVVDFHEVGRGEDGSKVLVAAVPKAGLRVLLQALEKKGVEPEVVDLDTMALYRVAHWCGAFADATGEEVLALDEDEAGDDAEAAVPAPVPPPVAVAPGAPRRIVAVLDIGARSTRVILVENGNLVEMRTLRSGDGALADDLARQHGLGLPQAREVVVAALQSGADQEVEVHDAPPALAEGDAAELPAAAARTVHIPYSDVEAAQTALLQRLARELARFLVAVGDRARVDAVWITGGASRLAGLREMLQEVFGQAPRDLDVMARLQHNLSPEQVEVQGRQLAVAIGLALGGLGGPGGFNLRQEDLVFTRGFDRVKFPLAITCMVALFAAVVYGVKLNNDLRNIEYRLGRTGEAQGKTVFYGQLNHIFPGGWFDDRTRFPDDKYRRLLADLQKAPVEQRLTILHSRLKQEVATQQNEYGIYEDLKLPSGLYVLTRFADLLDNSKGQLGRFLLSRVELNLPASGTASLSFRIAFHGDNRAGRVALESVLNEECGRPDSPFEKLLPVDEKPFTADANGVKGDGFYIVGTLHVRGNFEQP